MDTPRHERSLRWVSAIGPLERAAHPAIHLQQQEKEVGLGAGGRAWGGP